MTITFKKREVKSNKKFEKIFIIFLILLFYIETSKFKDDFISKEMKYMILMEGKEFLDKCLNQQNNIKIYQTKKNPKISSIIPVYNSEKTIFSSICSIQNQNFMDLEMILIDDFSSDNSLKIISSLQKNDKRIKIIKNKQNRGSLYSRSIGVLMSRGEYIFPLDNDDLFLSRNVFNYILKIAKSYYYDIVGFRAFRVANYNDKIHKIKDLYQYQYYPKDITIFQPQLSTWMITINEQYQPHDVTLWAKCIKTKVYKDATIRLGRKRYTIFVSWAEDAIVNYIIFNLAKSFKFIHNYGIIHLHNSSTASYSLPKEIKLFGEIYFIDIIYEFSTNVKNKNYAVKGVYHIKKMLKKKKCINNTIVTFFKTILNKFLSSRYISIENKNLLQKDFNIFFA